MARTISSVRAEYPNLVLGTTYALNKSNSKRVCVGLEYNDGYFFVVIKLMNSGSHRHVSLDENGWDSFKGQFDTIVSYFQNAYSFFHNSRCPGKLQLPYHEVDFTTSYGIKSITLDERSKPGASQEESQSSEDPACKKKLKFDQPSGIVMQQTTFEGLRIQSVLIELRLKLLKDYVGKVNRVLDIIFDYLKTKLAKESVEAKQNIFSNLASFKQFYAQHNADIEGFVEEQLIDDEDKFKSVFLQIVLSEIPTFNLPFIMRDLRAIVLPQ